VKGKLSIVKHGYHMI